MPDPGDHTLVVRMPPWWGDPTVGLIVFALPGVVIAYATPADRFLTLWGAPKYVSFGQVATALAAVGAFTMGSLWWRFVQRPPSNVTSASLDEDRLLPAFRFLAHVAYVSYSLWALLGINRGVRLSQFQAVLAGVPFAAFELKQLLAPVAGVTTFTQTVPIAAGIAGLLIRRGQVRVVLAPLTVLSGLALVRGYFLSERLAILEIGLPLVLAWLLARRTQDRHVPERRVGAAMFPLVYLAVAAALFAVFEYNRSWAYYRTVSDVSYSTFARERFLGYYTTPPNNAALLQRGDAALRPEPFTVQWLDQLPVLDLVVDLWSDRSPVTDILSGGGNPEFNTEGALFAPTIDWGPSASLVVWFLGGAAFAFIFERVRRGDAAFIPLFAVAYLGIVESGRYFYWGLGRAFVPLVAGLLVARYLSARSHVLGASTLQPRLPTAPPAAVGSASS